MMIVYKMLMRSLLARTALHDRKDGRDNITPPQQALDWILDLYDDVDEIRSFGQTIVYTVHETVGHLGIFVSGVAKKEHNEFSSNIDLIDMLPPGLYEATFERKTGDTAHPDPAAGRPRRPAKSPLHRELVEKRAAELKSGIAKGGLQECTIRGLIYVGAARGFVDERGVAALRRIRLTEEASKMTLAQFKKMAREQFFLLLLEPEATLAAIPKMLPSDAAERRKGLAAIRNILSSGGEIAGEAAERLKKVAALFGVDEAEPSRTGAERVSFLPSTEKAKAS
jgi:hypothetical protein